MGGVSVKTVLIAALAVAGVAASVSAEDKATTAATAMPAKPVEPMSQTGPATPAAAPSKEALVIFDFEKDLQEWVIPEWARTSTDHVGKDLSASADFASHGTGSLQLMADFPGGGKWTGAYAEIEMRVTDWSPFGTIAMDVYLPYNAPTGLKGRFILTAGEQWTWTEMNRGLALRPGQWTTITANLKPGSMDWKFFPDEKFRTDVRKIGIRIESDRAPTYKGPVFIDNIRLQK